MRNRPQTTTVLKPLQPVHGSCQWVHPPVLPCPLVPDGLPGLLLIHAHGLGNVYMISAHVDGTAGNRVVGWRLTKSNGDRYDIDAGTWACDCPDGTYRSTRPEGCKHSKAVRAALQRLGVITLNVEPVQSAPVDIDAAAQLAEDTGFLPRGHFDPETEKAIAARVPAEALAGHWYSRHFSGD